MSLNVLSLFSGIGGLELGLERAGMTTVGQVELDPYCKEVLATHWPEVPRHDDARTAPEWWLSEPRPRVDVVASGFPCQPFSQAGLQHGVADERWGWPWTADVIRTVRPKYVVVENVAALIRDADAFGWMLGDLADLGFDAEWTVLLASDVGAPHQRERLYLVAYPASSDGADQDEPAAPRPFELEPRGSSGEPWGPSWLPEPAVDRVAHGVPRQLVHDPLHALGNAVVPPLAEHVGRLIVDHHERSEVAA
jgi:DNA (cytosine-5)-methyltransferase 1